MTDDATATATLEPVDPPVRLPGQRGRLKGAPKVPGSGRKRGTPNHVNAATAEQIFSVINPLEFLAKIARGDRVVAVPVGGDGKSRVWLFPTLDQRITAATTLARKVMPDLKSVEYNGPIGAPVQVNINLGSPE